MKIFTRKKTILAAIEATYGVDAVPTGALNAIQTSQFSMQPLQGDALKPNLDKATFGADLSDLVGKNVVLTFNVPLAGSGVAGTAPAWGPLLKACGHSETLQAADPGNNVEAAAIYTPIDENVDSATFYFRQDRTLHKVTGVRGAVQLQTQKRDYAWLQFTFTGLFNPPVDSAADLGAVYTAWKKPVPFRAATVDCTLFGQLVGLHTLKLNFGQQVQFYEHSEEESVQITDRQADFDATFEETDLATHDYFADINNGTSGELVYTHGITAGNIVEIKGTNSQGLTVARSDQNGVSALQVTGPLAAVAPDPDYTITAK